MSLLDQLLGRNESLSPVTVSELMALLREQNQLLRESIRLSGGHPERIPRVVGIRKQYDASDVSVSGRPAQLRREREEQERAVAPHRFGPSSETTAPSDGSTPDTGILSKSDPVHLSSDPLQTA